MIDYVVFCAGCLGDILRSEMSVDGYCESCQYEHEQKLDNETGDNYE